MTLKYPELFPVLQKATVEETRRKMENAQASQCMKENVPLLEEVIKLRHSIALPSLSLSLILIVALMHYHSYYSGCTAPEIPYSC